MNLKPTNSETSVIPDGPATGSFGAAIFGRVLALLNGVGSIWILSITLLIFADILSRLVISKPIAGVAEMVSLSIVGIVFLQLGHTIKSDRLTRADLFLKKLSRSAPRSANFLNGFYYSVGALFFLTLLYGSFPKFIDSWSADEHVGVYGIFVAPVWPIRVIVLVGCLSAALQFAIYAAGYFSRNNQGLSGDGA